MMAEKTMLPPDQVAANIRKILAADPRSYRNFGVYWYFVKAFLKRYYSREEMPILGAFEQDDVVARMPEYGSLQDALHDALLTWRQNYESNMGRAESIGPDGDLVTLFDEDVGL
jgi:hypothetical protein